MNLVFEDQMKSHAKAQRRKERQAFRTFANVALCVSLLLAPALASALDFDREIRPLLKERCVECHGPETVPYTPLTLPTTFRVYYAVC